MNDILRGKDATQRNKKSEEKNDGIQAFESRFTIIRQGGGGDSPGRYNAVVERHGIGGDRANEL